MLGALLLQGLYSIPLSPRVHLRAVALDLLTDVLLPSSDLKQCILCFAALLWRDLATIDLLHSATEILPAREAQLLHGWTARHYPEIFQAYLRSATDAWYLDI